MRHVINPFFLLVPPLLPSAPLVGCHDKRGLIGRGPVLDIPDGTTPTAESALAAAYRLRKCGASVVPFEAETRQEG